MADTAAGDGHPQAPAPGPTGGPEPRVAKAGDPGAGGGELVAWRRFLDRVTERLEEAGLPSPGPDARRLLEEVSGHRGAALHAHLDDPASRLGVAHLEGLLARRVAGEPLQYVLGNWSFRKLDLFVDPRVLIPRPETETLVDRALAELDRQGVGGHEPARVADLGTGSGAIALSLAAERPRTEVVATDISVDALEVARANLAGLGRPATRVELREGSWFDALDPSWRGHLVVANPPYVARDDPLPDDVRRWEPPGALVAGTSGTEALEVLVDGALDWLEPGGALVVELAPHQADQVAKRAGAAGWVEVDTHPDLAGRARVLVARRPS